VRLAVVRGSFSDVARVIVLDEGLLDAGSAAAIDPWQAMSH
jgi:hypothetical protein